MLTCKKALFDLEEDVTFLNTSYMSPLMKSVINLGLEGARKKLRPYLFSDEDFFEEPDKLKKIFSTLIDNSDYKRIALIPSASYGIENAARNIPFEKGDEIMVVSQQFPSNIYPWMEIAKTNQVKLTEIDSPEEYPNKGDVWNTRILEGININTKVVAIPHVHWSEGIIFDLQKIRQRTNEIGAFLVVDGTQSVGALPFSVKEIEPDALICSTYKWLMGPYGSSLAYYGERFDHGSPIENNWINRQHSEDFSQLVQYQEKYKPGAARYSVGEHSNFILIPMMQKAIQTILEWQPRAIQEYCGTILDPLSKLSENGFFIPDQDQRSNHLIGIRIPKHINPKELKMKLNNHKIFVSVRNKHLRVSPYVFNREEDLAKLVDVTLGLK
jgi:selenocysteine lyase/cysteine desulfurase